MRRHEVAEQILQLGVRPGDVLLVHTAFSRVRPVDGGPGGLIDALQDAVGDDGTLVMPSMADTDDEPFDAAKTPCTAMGIVAETFRQLPDVLRSDSPHAFAARGRHASVITAPHPVQVPHGHDSPAGRIFDLDGQVLLLGVGHDANTTIHLAENLAGVRYRQRYSSMVLQDGRPVRVAYEEVDHCCENFARLDEWLDAEGAQRRGTVGRAEARLVSSRDIVRLARAALQERETVFLHDPGVCEECDAARLSIPPDAVR